MDEVAPKRGTLGKAVGKWGSYMQNKRGALTVFQNDLHFQCGFSTFCMFTGSSMGYLKGISMGYLKGIYNYGKQWGTFGETV